MEERKTAMDGAGDKVKMEYKIEERIEGGCGNGMCIKMRLGITGIIERRCD